MLERLLKSNAEVKILEIILFQEGLHLREIARKTGLSPYETKRELDNLTEMDILVKEKKGNLIIFYQNKSCPFIKDLKNLYLKTERPFMEIKQCLKDLKGIKYAFIFGSMAKGTYNRRSDIDLMVIGNIPDEILSEKIFQIQKENVREINFIHWMEENLKVKIREMPIFLKNINNKKKWLVGDRNEFERIIKERSN